MNLETLAPWASQPARTRGRRINEPAALPGSAYRRDCGRIVHRSALRRLVCKTRVFINHQGDLFHTRLTHGLEVAQLGRSVARALHLNEDLSDRCALREQHCLTGRRLFTE